MSQQSWTTGLLSLSLGLSLITGCNQPIGSAPQASSRGGIAVVDLDKVAQQTGKQVEMADALALRESALKQQLVGFQTSLQDQIKAKQDEFGEAPTDEQTAKLRQAAVIAQNQVAQLQAQAGAELTKYKDLLVARFRNDLRPLLQDVASDHGLSVVIPKNEGLLLSVDPAVDITDDVIAKMKSLRTVPAKTVAATEMAPATPAASSESASAAAGEEGEASVRPATAPKPRRSASTAAPSAN